MTPTPEALAKAKKIICEITSAIENHILDATSVIIALALDAERAAVWEEATKMVNELWSATVPLLPASFIGLGAMKETVRHESGGDK